jgi:hypothetical protein
VVQKCLPLYGDEEGFMYDHYAIIRDGKEIERLHDVHHYTQDIIAAQITFYDVNRKVLRKVAAEVGDVIRPVVIGFNDPFPPIDQSPERKQELAERMRRLRLFSSPVFSPIDKIT